ncbi:MAG: hypothetical protein Q9209_000078 [Squamulea sp. 1 TL-2023]
MSTLVSALPSGPSTVASTTVANASPHGIPNLTQTSTVAWLPLRSKGELASAVKSTISANPNTLNKAETLHLEEIIGILTQHHSFDGLCAIIDAKGLINDRGLFARSLLAAIPEMARIVDGPMFRTSVSCYFFVYPPFKGPLPDYRRFERDYESLQHLHVQLHHKHLVSSEDPDIGDDRTKTMKPVWKLKMADLVAKTECWLNEMKACAEQISENNRWEVFVNNYR